VGAAVVVVLTIALDAAGLASADPSGVVAEPETTAGPNPSTVVAIPPSVAGRGFFRGDEATAPETARDRGAANPVTAVVDFEAPERISSLEDPAPGIDPATVPDPDPGPDVGEMDPPAFAIVYEMGGVVDLAPAALPALGVTDAAERADPVAAAATGAGRATRAWWEEPNACGATKAAATAAVVTATPANAVRHAPPPGPPLPPGARAATRWAARTTTVRMAAPTPSRKPAKGPLDSDNPWNSRLNAWRARQSSVSIVPISTPSWSAICW
jgi:hypothetical protein